MHFLFYLTPIAQELTSLIMLKNYRVQENAPICKKYTEIFGYNSNGNFIICTNNIKNTISPAGYYINETVYHEAVHVAQACKKGPLGVMDISLSPQKLNDVARSVNYNESAFTYEVEAYYLEDKPEEVLSYVKKYCF